MKARLACAAVAAIVGQSFLGAQSSDAPPATGFILGRVIDGSTERPMGGVVVTLLAGDPGAAPSPPGRPGGTPPPRVVADAAGRFVFSGVRPGRYSIQISNSSGILPGGYGLRRPGGAAQPIDLAPGGRLGDVTVRAWRRASISGTLTDQSGEPIAETRVSALRITIAGGVRRFMLTRTTITDDRGAFHLSRLDPGEYTIYLPFPQVTIPASAQAAYDAAATGGQAGREQLAISMGESGAPSLSNDGFRVGGHILVRGSNSYGADGAIGPMLTTPAPDEAGHMLVYPMTFYPGVTSLSEAATFVLESGQERVADLQAQLVPAARLSGAVVGPDGPVPMVGVRLIPASSMDAVSDAAVEAASTVTDASGAFTFLGVPAGQYVLKVARTPIAPRPNTSTSLSVGGMTMFTSVPESELPPAPLAQGETLSASMSVTISDQNPVDLLVTLRPGPRVSGRLEYDGASERLTNDQLLRAVIALEPIDGRTVVGGTGRGQFDATGRFTTLGLLPGRYLLRVTGNLGSWVLASASVGALNIADTPVTIGTDDIGGVVIKLTDRGSTLTGTVRTQTGVDPNAVVLAFPFDRASWTNTAVTPRRLRTSRVSAQGTFTVTNVPPGEYFVIAIDDKDAENWQDPRRLDAFSRLATRVSIQPGERHTADLTAATVAVR